MLGLCFLIQKCKEIRFSPDFSTDAPFPLVSFNAVFWLSIAYIFASIFLDFFPPTFRRTIPNTFGGRAVEVKCIFESYTVAFSVYIWPLLLGEVGKTLFISEMVSAKFPSSFTLPRRPRERTHTHDTNTRRSRHCCVIYAPRCYQLGILQIPEASPLTDG